MLVFFRSRGLRFRKPSGAGWAGWASPRSPPLTATDQASPQTGAKIACGVCLDSRIYMGCIATWLAEVRG